MIYPDIRFHSPRSLAEALGLLRELGNARLIAGGTDLLIDLKEGLADAGSLVSLGRIDELRAIGLRDGWLEIGAMATAKEIAADPRIVRHNPALAFAAAVMASPHVRSLATIGGNISSAVPSADLPPSLIAADAEIRLAGPEGRRDMPLSSFFAGPRRTACGRGEILVAVRFPLPPPETGISFQRFSYRGANALAVAAVAARLTLKRGRIARAAIVLASVAPTPLLAVKAGASLLGQAPDQALFASAAALAREECRAISDVRGSAWFRREMIEVLTRRALAEAGERARGDPPEESARP